MRPERVATGPSHARRPRGPRRARPVDALLALLVLAFAPPCFATPAGLTDCDGPAARTLIAAADKRSDARAYWLDATHVRWPGTPADGRYRLVRSNRAALHVDADSRIAGADAAWPLIPGAAVDIAAFAFVPAGANLALAVDAAHDVATHADAQWWLVREDSRGRVLDATGLQWPGLLDAAFDGARADLGLHVDDESTRFGVWAPTASQVALCVYDTATSAASAVESMRRDATTGAWSAQRDGDLRGRYYAFVVDVFVPGTGRVRNRLTDPYAVSLAPESTRSAILDLDDASLQPDGWTTHPRPSPAPSNVDMTLYELHVRDFSIADASVPAAYRGKYLAFTSTTSNGMRHLRALRDAGLTDLHLLPVFDFASVPEQGCVTPSATAAAPDDPAPQAAIAAVAARDCYNWGYDPYHFGAPEGSYATVADAATRVREFRAMVQALHAIGLRVGMDVVYNHVHASGQADTSVLDRIVPGYYLRLDANGSVERSTCCANTATEHRMMARLMTDTLVRWTRDYGIDSFRFDLMGHQPRDAMLRARDALRVAVRHDVPLIGEGWNFGEVADGARFVQAAQGRLDGTGIATFSDRARDALRGGGCCDSGVDLLRQQGWLNGLVYAPNARADARRPRSDLLHAADLVRAGLAGTLGAFPLRQADGRTAPLSALAYAGQPAGYAASPGEVVNYVENHDNLTLFDLNALRLPAVTTAEERARVQTLGVAAVALSQGIPYFHAGLDVLRSKSLDRNSFDSGDAFNAIDWRYTDNGFGRGLPKASDNGKDWPLLAPVLRSASIQPPPPTIAWMRDVFRDWLRLRAATPLLRLRTADEVIARLTFPDAGPSQNPTLLVGHLDGRGISASPHRDVLYLLNAAPEPQSVTLPDEAGKPYVLHPVLAAGRDARARQARIDADGRVTVPARTAVVFVVPAGGP